jgi:hypothetical protein
MDASLSIMPWSNEAVTATSSIFISALETQDLFRKAQVYEPIDQEITSKTNQDKNRATQSPWMRIMLIGYLQY